MAKMNKNISKLVIEKPVVGGSVDVWGSIINKDLDNIGAFADEVATKMDTHDQEIANLTNDKVSKDEVETTITPIVNNYVENTVKPNIDTYINDVSKPAIDKYVDGKKPTIDKHITDELAKQIEANKGTLDTYVETDEKPKLDAYEKEKEKELDTYVTTTAQTAIDTYVTDTTKPSLDAYEKEKEQELDTFKETKTTEITAHTDEEKERITTEVSNVAGTAKQSVTNEGTKQVGLVTVEGNKVIEQVKTLVEGNHDTTNALTLSGKTRPEFEKEVQGVIGEYEGTFPLTSAVQNKVYYIPTIGKYYRCKTAYNGTQLTMPNENFEEISTSINSDRLSNLYGYKLIATVDFPEKGIEKEVYDFGKNIYGKDNYNKGYGSPFMEIIVFLHNSISDSWGGYREVKFATYSRPNEDVVELYNIGDGGYNNSVVKLNRATKKLTVTSSVNNMLCDVYAMFLPHSNLINKK